MVLTVTLNPLLERRFTFSKINFNNDNRNGVLTLNAGGKGINVSRQLNKLKVDSIALLFAGGQDGKILREILRGEQIKFSDIQTKAPTRSAAVIIETESKNITTLFGSNSTISENECRSFLVKMEKMIPNCEIVVFAGSSPCDLTDELFTEGINIAKRYDKISICDTYGVNLINCIEASPTILHTNIDEAETTFKLELRTEKQKRDYLNLLYSKEIKQIYLTDGANTVYASNFDFHYSVSIPKIDVADPTGSGDAFVAGLAYGIHNNFVFENQLIFASSLGIRNAGSFETCSVSFDEANDLLTGISVQQIGKKVKTINDTPD